MKLSEIIKACGGSALFDAKETEISGITTDSRKISDNCIFICIKGDRFDGHDFAAEALEKGAAAVVSEKRTEGNIILVENTVRAFQDIASFYASQFSIPKIGVTGSVGKTTTKELIHSVLSVKYNAFKNEANLNSQTGVPITLMRLTDEYEAAVIEMGVSNIGEMDRLVRTVKPTAAVMTNIGESHIEFFGTKQGIFNEKSKIFSLMSQDSPVIINGDDPVLLKAKELHKNVITCGFDEGCDFRASDVVEKGFEGSSFTVSFRGRKQSCFIPAPGRHMILNSLIALACAEYTGISLSDAVKGIASFVPTDGRMKIIDTGRYTLLSDAYNANPTSMKASISSALSQKGRRVLILGDMYELGEGSPAYHREIGEYAAKHGADLVIAVGRLAKDIFEAAKKNGADSLYFETKEAMEAELPAFLKQNDTVLVKASHGMKLFETACLIERL